MPFKSVAQKRLMEAAAHTKGGYGGVSQTVGKKFVAHDMSGPDWSKLGSLITKWLREEAAEPEHAEDEGTEHDPKNGQFTSGGHTAPNEKQDAAKSKYMTRLREKMSVAQRNMEIAASNYQKSGNPKFIKEAERHKDEISKIKNEVEFGKFSKFGKDDASPKRAAGILYATPDGRVLLLKRAGIEGRDNYVGHWALPGGGVNADEQPIDGAAREAREEIGHDADVNEMRLIDRTTTPSGMEFHTFRHDVDAPFDPKLNDEHSAHMWASPEKLPEPMHPAVEKLLKSGVVNDAGTASDCIAMDRDSVRTKDEDGHLHVERAHISKACVNPYYGHEIPEADKLGLDPKKIYYLLRDPEELKKAASTFAGKPLLKGHTPAFAADHPADSVAGSVGHDIAFNHPYLDAPLTVWDGDAIDGIESDRQRELSSSYRYDADMTPGSFEGKKYDGVMRNIRGNHVALVETGRAGSDVLVGDEMPKSLTKQAKDSKENIMSKHKPALSRHADYVRGALTVYLGPKLAKDAKIDLVSVLKGTTARNFKTVRPTVVLDIKKALNGKLARDASLDDVNLLLDKLEPSKEAMDEEELEEKMPMSPKDKAGEAEDDDMDNMSFDDDREAELREMLEGKHEPEEIERICAMMKPEAAKDEPPKFKEMPEVGGKPAKDDDEEKDKMKGMVSKPAMDAALKKNRDETIAEMRRQFADRTEAQSLVRPLIGEVTVAMDTAAKILTAALDHAGVEHDGITDLKALRRLTEVVVKNVGDSERAATRRPRIAADSADKITEFNKKHGITHSTMRHI